MFGVMKQDRLQRLLQGMEAVEMPQMLVSDPASLYYLTGQWFSPGERMLALYVSLEREPLLFLNELFPLQEELGVEVVRFDDTQDAVVKVAERVRKNCLMGVDKNWLARFLLRLMELGGGNRFVNGSAVLDRLRMCKDQEEISLMRAASRVNDRAMKHLIELIPQELSEKAMARQLLDIYEGLGAQGFSFTPIVAYGAHAVDPHHKTGTGTVRTGDCVLFDVGCKKDSYCADMTRTVFYRQVTPLGCKVYETVLEANRRALDAVKPGVRFCDIDAAARQVIEAAGYGANFTHRTGHSIGLETHDFGDVSAVNTESVQPGMIFSIEPGIYLPGQLGVRIEDLVLVTDDGCEVLNAYPKELTIVE